MGDIFNDSLDPVKIKWKTEHVDEEHDNRVTILWSADHGDWDSTFESNRERFAREPRVMPDELLQVKMSKAGDSPEGEWDPKIKHSRLGSAEKEIWGVIRAEYYFIKLHPDAPWRKIASKYGRTGIDSLFKHPSHRMLICESKASGNGTKFTNYKAGKNSALGLLKPIQDPSLTDHNKKAREKIIAAKKAKSVATRPSAKKCAAKLLEAKEYEQDLSDCITTRITQMTRRWTIVKAAEMLAAGDQAAKTQLEGDYRRAAVQNGLEVIETIADERLERWFNYYGHDDHFYRLPGAYTIAGGSAEFSADEQQVNSAGKHEWGFPDRVEKAEFLHLDKHEPWNLSERTEEDDRAMEAALKGIANQGGFG